MDPDAEILIDFPPYFRIYRSGRVERYKGTETVPAGLDPATGVLSRDVTIDAATGVSARLYLPKITAQSNNKKKLPVLVYYHGSAFCIYSASCPLYHRYLNSLVSRANVVAVSVDYRLAPENPLPAAYEDSWAALNWALSSGDQWLTEYGDLGRVFVGGDSAGANITHRMLLTRGVRVEGVVLIDPYFWGAEPIGSETRDPKTRSWMEELWRLVNRPGVDMDSPWINPLAAGAPSLAGLGCGRAIVCVAGADTLVERGRAYYEALRRSGWGGEAELVVSEGEPHVFHLEKPECEKARELMDRVVAFFGFQDMMLHTSTETSSHVTLEIPMDIESTINSKIDKKCLNFLSDVKYTGWTNKDNPEVNNTCTKLEEELWETGKERMKTCIGGVFLGFLCILFLFNLKMV